MSRDALLEALDAAADAMPRILEMATQEERAAVVAWLRDEEYHILALAIERGEHRRKEE